VEYVKEGVDTEFMNADSCGVALILFARFPRPGAVKTRLAATIGNEAAAGFYRLCVEHIVNESADLSHDVDRFVFCAERNELREMQEWVGQHFEFEVQVGADLGERMENAFSLLFSHGAQKAILVGTDVPDLSAHIMDDAVNGLDTCDVVIGPCQDGGYYLLGIKELHEELFKDIPWSTGEVFDRTLDKVAALGLTLRHLPTLADIDTEEELRRWFESSRTGPNDPVRAFVAGLDISEQAVGSLEEGGESP
jgi:rSAM/selenodomain-associated transferase 1